MFEYEGILVSKKNKNQYSGLHTLLHCSYGLTHDIAYDVDDTITVEDEESKKWGKKCKQR